MVLPQKTRGNSFGDQAFDRLVDALKSVRPMRGDGTQTRSTPYGISRRASPVPPQGKGGWNFSSPIELGTSPYPSFPAQTVIHIQSTHSLVTAGIVDAGNPGGPVVKSTAGLWVSKQAVPGQSLFGSTPIWNLPQLPLPNSANYDDPKNFWVLVCPDAICF